MSLRVPMFLQALLILIVSYAIFRYGITPPIPSSLLYMFMATVVLATALYVSSSEEAFQDFLHPIVATLRAEWWFTKILRVLVFLLFPAVVGYLTFLKTATTVEAPAELRVIHPAPPNMVEFKGKPINIQNIPENPLRKDQANFQKHVDAGKVIYYENCHFCHGDNLSGKGQFAHGFNPPPANFVDIGTIAQLQESFLFWRIAKGGPGLPNESTPWSSAMPAWENYLSEEEIWQVILYLYEATGHPPRRWEQNSGGGH
jgi:mono/diheme cytochrome c family protein